GEKRTNESTVRWWILRRTLPGKRTGSHLCCTHAMHLMSENRQGLIVDVDVTEANGRAERDAGLRMLRRTRMRHDLPITTLAADKGYDAGVLSACRGGGRGQTHDPGSRRRDSEPHSGSGRTKACAQTPRLLFPCPAKGNMIEVG